MNMPNVSFPDKFVPLVYFVTVCLAAVGLKAIDLDATTTGMIIGAGLMRVKIPAPPPPPPPPVKPLPEPE